jgi:concanavalin A-like lectin/glucanase superfamily protein
MKKIFVLIAFFCLFLQYGFGGGSASFDGTGDYYTTSFTNSANGNRFLTIGAWVLSNDVVGTKQIYGEVTPTTTARINFFIGATEQVGVGGRASDAAGFTTWITAGAATAIGFGSWRHVVFIFNSVTDLQELYIDGIRVVNQAQADVPFSNTNGSRVPEIGATGNAGQTWNGRIAQIFVSSSALTADQVMNIYNCADFPIPNLLGYWPMWDDRSQYDLSGINGNATPVGDAITSQDGPPINFCNGGGFN